MRPFSTPAPRARRALVAAVLALTTTAVGQAGLRHEIGWLPEPNGPIVATRFADLDGDTFQDLVRLRPRAVEMLLQDPTTGRFTRVDTVALGTSAMPDLQDIAIGRLDPSGDPWPDVAVLWSDGQLDLLVNNAGAGLTRAVPRPVPALPAASAQAIFAADLDGDLADDLLVLQEATPPQLITRQPAGGFTNVTATNMPAAIAYPRPRGTLADTDGDGDLDLIVASVNPLPPTLLRNQGGTFTRVASAFANNALPTSAVLAIDLAGTPLPELVFGRPGTANNAPIVLANVGGVFNSVMIPQSLRVRGVRALLAADIDQNGHDDVVVLESTGRLGFALRGNGGLLAGRPTSTANVTETVPLLPIHPGRVAAAVADLENDGDDDLVAGGDAPDSLLVHGPGVEFHDAERFAFEAGARVRDYAATLADRDLDGNRDLIGLEPNGGWLTFDNDGSGYFTASTPAVSVLPALPAVTIWERVFAMSVQTPGRLDLLAFGDGSGVADQVAVLRKTAGGWVDETQVRFGGAQTGVIAAVAGYENGSGLEDLIVGTFTGELEFHANVGGIFTYQPGRFPNGLGLFNLTQILVADFTGDGNNDVLALQGNGQRPRLLVATPVGFAPATLAVPLAADGDFGTVGDVDQDGDPDVVLRTTGQVGVTVLRWQAATGSFAMASLGAIVAVNFEPRDIAVLTVDGAPRIVLARDDGPDAIYAWNGSSYVGPLSLGYRGTVATRGFLLGDVDRDRDQDVLVLRAGLDPALLMNETTLVQPLGPVQSGRANQVLLRAPEPGSLAFIAYGLPRDTLTPWGLLRLDPATIGSLFLGVPPGRETTWNLPLGPGLPWIRFPIQAAWITPGNEVFLSGLNHLVILP